MTGRVLQHGTPASWPGDKWVGGRGALGAMLPPLLFFVKFFKNVYFC